MIPPASSDSSNSNLLGALAGTAAALTAAGSLYLLRQYRKNIPTDGPERPQLVLDSIAQNIPIYYFGVGSNLSRKKLEGRAACEKKIDIISMEPCIVPDHRLAFNMRAIPPLEPAMAGLEPLNGKGPDGSNLKRQDSIALRAYENEECHGALICLSPEDYARVYKSEGGGSGAMQGYEEIIVTCIPYDDKKDAVEAVAYRAREHVLLATDVCPSKRYMDIIREGAKELGLKPCYQKWLAEHPVQQSSWLLRKVALNNMVFSMTLSFALKIRIVSHIQSSLLFAVYVLPTAPGWKQIAGEVASFAILLPGAIIGLAFKGLLGTTGTMPAAFSKWLKAIDE